MAKSKKGESNGYAKLYPDDIHEIRSSRELRKRYPRHHPLSTASLARRYGITASQVSKILHRQQWRHL